MSWSFDGVGRPAALKRALDRSLDDYTPGTQSRAEFGQAVPHLKGLLDAAGEDDAMCLSANGHAVFEAGRRVHAVIHVDLRPIGRLCE